jgi:DNA-binding transcriptional ArsR family regulator
MPELAATFAALSDPTRLIIVERLLREGERSVGELAEPLPISMPAVSRHIRVLEDAGLIERRVDRQWRRYRVRPDRLKEVDEWLSHYRAFWTASFDRLERLVTKKRRRK